MEIYTKAQITSQVNLKKDFTELLSLQKRAFIDYSNGKTIVPSPLQLSFKNPSGDCHIKAGYKINEKYFMVKLATGFYEKATGDGLILILNQKTGIIEAILHDEGWLTQLRTALAACIAAKLTNFKFDRIGIIGTGNQAQACLNLLYHFYPLKKFFLWGRDFEKACSLTSKMKYIDLCPKNSLSNLISSSQVIITATSSDTPLIKADDLHEAKHIIALGADEKGKQELDPLIFKKAKTIIVDSLTQCTQFGETSYALELELIQPSQIQELGKMLERENNPLNSNDIMVTDLTGIATQDIYLAEWIYSKLQLQLFKGLSFRH